MNLLASSSDAHFRSFGLSTSLSLSPFLSYLSSLSSSPSFTRGRYSMDLLQPSPKQPPIQKFGVEGKCDHRRRIQKLFHHFDYLSCQWPSNYASMLTCRHPLNVVDDVFRKVGMPTRFTPLQPRLTRSQRWKRKSTLSPNSSQLTVVWTPSLRYGTEETAH